LDASAPSTPSLAIPPDVVSLDLARLYDRLAEKGIAYGAAFRALVEVKRRGSDLYARLSLPPHLTAHGFAIHPVLLDAGFHALLAAAIDAELRVPFELKQMWIARAESSPRTLSVHLAMSLEGGAPAASSMSFFDETGAAVASVGWVGFRGISADKLSVPARRSKRGGELYRVEWSARPATRSRPAGCAVVGSGEQSHEVAAALRNSGVLVVRFDRPTELADRLRQQDAGVRTVVRVLEPRDDADAALPETVSVMRELDEWSSAGLLDYRYALVTPRAIATRADEAPSLAHAPLGGLLRSVRNERADREWILLDTDGTDASHQILAASLAGDEPEAALRKGERLVPRLVRSEVGAIAPPLSGTVLITGGTSGLGREVAKHLALHRGVRRLLLLSRSGDRALGAAELVKQLEEVGCTAAIEACDVSDLDSLRRAIDSIPASQPLSGVFHCSAVLEDAMSPSPEEVGRIFAPKAIGAWNLHQLTRERELSAFVMFSSIAGIIGNEGQSAYAAANAFLDGLSAHRRALGLPACSLAWGTWSEVGMAARLSARHQERIRQAGIAPLHPEAALALLDEALLSREHLSIPLRLDDDFVQKKDASTPLGRLLFGQPVKQETTLSLRERIDDADPPERERMLLELVQAEVAAVLKLGEAKDLPPEKQLDELGMDSLMAVDIRRRLEKRLAMRLPPTLAFDHPSSGRLVRYLLGSWKEPT
jgi:NAD(P)-dependent dehydrogenase (short-subunit alcohol dehydrogenase family)/acyl carrier protein